MAKKQIVEVEDGLKSTAVSVGAALGKLARSVGFGVPIAPKVKAKAAVKKAVAAKKPVPKKVPLAKKKAPRVAATAKQKAKKK